MAKYAIPRSTHGRISQLRLKMAILRLRLVVKAGFDSNQPRDELGRWTDGGSGQVAVTRTYRTGNSRIDSTTDTLTDIAKDVILEVGPGYGSAYGILVHKKFASKIRELNLPGIGTIGVEESYSIFEMAGYGLNGSVRTDIILRDGQTRNAPILAVWDLKTGSARLEPKRPKELRSELGIGNSVPVIEIHVDRGISVKAHAIALSH